MAVDITALRSLLRDDDSNVFTNAELQAAIDATGDDSILRAAGQAVQSLAMQYALAGKSIKTDDLGLDTTKRGSTLLDVAKSFFDEAAAADAAEADGGFQIVGFSGRPASANAYRVEGSPWPLTW